MAADLYKNASTKFGQESNVVSGFFKFLTQGNVLDMAVGLVMGTAITAIVTSLTRDILMPIIGNMVSVDFSKDFYAWKKDKKRPYIDAEEAQKDGAVVLKYGHLLQATINFVIQALVIYLVIKAYTEARNRIGI